MTILEAIQRADALCPNQFEEHEKVKWLSQLDGQIYEEIVKTHEGAGEWFPYTPDTLQDTQLLVPFPFDDIYIIWLEMKIDYYNGETARYNNAAAVFNARFGEFRNWYNRTHTPLGVHKHTYFGAEKKTPRVIGKEGERIADPLSE